MNAFEYIGKEKIKEIIKSSSSIKEVIEKVGLESTSNYRTFHNIIKKFSLEKDFLELKERSILKNKKAIKEKAENLITINDFCKDSRRTRGDIKKYILNHNLLTYKCSECGLGDKYNGKPLTLQLDHINGDNKDNRLENLRFLCPNCHTQTETYGSKNIKSHKSFEKLKLAKILAKEKVFEERKKDVYSFDLKKRGWVSALAEKWNTSRSQVRKWIKSNLPEIILFESTSKGITPEILEKRKKEKELKQQIKKEQILKLQSLLENSNIDFSKRGWQTELGILWNKDRRTAADIFYRNFAQKYTNIYKHKK